MSQQAKQLRELKAGIFRREIRLDRAAIDKEKRTVALSFSSEEPVERFNWEIGDYNEVLDHDPKSVRLDRVRSGAVPLLVNHNANDVVGKTEEATIAADRKGRAVVRFGRSARAEEIFNDVIDGIRETVSVGYRVYTLMADKVEQGLQTLRATDWEIFELSLATIPADAGVGVGRAAEEQNTITLRFAQVPTSGPVVTKDMNTILRNAIATEGGGISAASTAPAVTAPAAPSLGDIRKAEALRAQEIRALAKRTGKPDMLDLAETAIEQGTTVDEFRRTAFERAYPAAKPLDIPSPEIGMSKKELRSYSILRAIRQSFAGRLDGLEKEASDAVAAKLPESQRSTGPGGFYIPWDTLVETRAYPMQTRSASGALQVRDLSAGTPSEGGYTVQTNVLVGSLIEVLRNRMVTANLGAQMLSGLTGNISIPKVVSGSSAGWTSETGTASGVSAVFGQVPLTPKRLTAVTVYSRTLTVQSGLNIEDFVRSDLFASCSVELDKAAIQGTGGSGQPTGILNQSPLSTPVSFAVQNAPSWNELVSFETNVANNNADGDGSTLGYLVSPSARGRLKTTPKVTNQAFFIFESDPLGRPGWGEINGYPAVASKQIPEATNVLFARWNELIIGTFDGLFVQTNPFSLDVTNQIRVVMTLLADVGVRHTQSFCPSSNAIT